MEFPEPMDNGMGVPGETCYGKGNYDRDLMKFEADRRRDFEMLTVHEETVHDDSILFQRDQLPWILGRFPGNHVLGMESGRLICDQFHSGGIDHPDLCIGLRDRVVRNFDGNCDFFGQNLHCLVDF